jgi:hypothetical protein
MTVELENVNGTMRTIYRQIDGGIIFADECKCGDKPTWECPIDEHRIRALQAEVSHP